MFLSDKFDFSKFGVGLAPQGGVAIIIVDVRVRFQVDLELPVASWFAAVRCAEIEIVVVVLREQCARVYLWALEYLFVDGKVCL